MLKGGCMNKIRKIVIVFFVLGAVLPLLLSAQKPQIPTLQVCNYTNVAGKAKVEIIKRSDKCHTGTFELLIKPDNPLRCDSASGYPAGAFQIANISMSDSTVNGDIYSTTIEQITTTGKHTPTVFLSGKCKVKTDKDTCGVLSPLELKGCRYWLMIADNKLKGSEKGTPDIIGFLVVDKDGRRIAYGTGPVVAGDIDAADTPN
jgi:hypothetical protein